MSYKCFRYLANQRGRLKCLFSRNYLGDSVVRYQSKVEGSGSNLNRILENFTLVYRLVYISAAAEI